DAVLHKLRDSLERIALRERDDTDSIPIIADPLSDSFDFAALIFATMIRNFDATAREGRPLLVCQQPLTIPTVLAGRQDWRGCRLEMTLYPGDSRKGIFPQPRGGPHDPRSFCVEQGSLPQSFRPKSSCVYFSPFCFSFLIRAKCVSC